jgi:hypothetical protein
MEEGGMQEVSIKKVSILSSSIYSLAVWLIVGFILGLVLMTVAFFIPPTIGGFNISSYLSWGNYSVIILPVLFGVFGFIFGVIRIVLYNLLAKLTGGIKIYS